MEIEMNIVEAINCARTGAVVARPMDDFEKSVHQIIAFYSDLPMLTRTIGEDVGLRSLVQHNSRGYKVIIDCLIRSRDVVAEDWYVVDLDDIPDFAHDILKLRNEIFLSWVLSRAVFGDADDKVVTEMPGR
jgi:hypothetical protein